MFCISKTEHIEKRNQRLLETPGQHFKPYRDILGNSQRVLERQRRQALAIPSKLSDRLCLSYVRKKAKKGIFPVCLSKSQLFSGKYPQRIVTEYNYNLFFQKISLPKKIFLTSKGSAPGYSQFYSIIAPSFKVKLVRKVLLYKSANLL